MWFFVTDPTEAYPAYVTYLLNIPKLVTFMQGNWAMLPIIARKVFRGPKTNEDCRHEALQKMLESDSSTNSNY